ncbi:MAG: isopentenyl-diphosphate delta-isomerase [Candidatus Pacebacteria bacterium CG10_big_fil_rev_8_21_14_0_10_42_12]|nr:isopentenyl-diphosphate Delta-isomerase [Candidatus Paceibacterota bacterium]PIR62369.1 MAG: isopentenyl-diphosphate delta-isomerase [Candidatus Pacebacteria bacterium CG10_big_fil_rev_8_21_14_0_10_42_12]
MVSNARWTSGPSWYYGEQEIVEGRKCFFVSKMGINMHQLDKVILVNQKDEVIGEMDKMDAHRGEGKLHRAISVFLFRKLGDDVELLIQQRSAKKIVGAHQWANTVCGNVRPGETYEVCARRRLEEELGIIDPQLILTPAKKFQYQVKCNEEFSENEIDQIFTGWFDGELNINPDEVQKVDWISWQSLQNGKYADLEYNWAPWFVIMMESAKEIYE